VKAREKALPFVEILAIVRVIRKRREPVRDFMGKMGSTGQGRKHNKGEKKGHVGSTGKRREQDREVQRKNKKI
jgi:hypothetical protein